MTTILSAPALSGPSRRDGNRINPDARQGNPTPMLVHPTLTSITGGHGISGAAAHGQRPALVLVCGGGMSTAPIGLSLVSGNAGCHGAAIGRTNGGVVRGFQHRPMAENPFWGQAGSLLEFTHGVGTSAAPGAIATDIRETGQEGDRRVADFPARGLGYLIARKAVYNPASTNRIHGKGEPYHCNDTAPHRRISTIRDTSGKGINSHEGIFNMANRPHPVDEYLIKRSDRRNRAVRLFMVDGVLSPAEREWLEDEEEESAQLKRWRAKRRYFDHLERGEEITPYTKRLGADAGLEVIDLTAVKDMRKIVPLFPGIDEDDQA